MHQAPKSEQETLHARVTEAAKCVDLSADPTAAIDACNTMTTASADPTLTAENTVESWGGEQDV